MMVTGALYFCVCKQKDWHNVSNPESRGCNYFEARIQHMDNEDKFLSAKLEKAITRSKRKRKVLI